MVGLKEEIIFYYFPLNQKLRELIKPRQILYKEMME